eukprot:12939291-Prorocentrum_lima.AAC.1
MAAGTEKLTTEKLVDEPWQLPLCILWSDRPVHVREGGLWSIANLRLFRQRQTGVMKVVLCNKENDHLCCFTIMGGQDCLLAHFSPFCLPTGQKGFSMILRITSCTSCDRVMPLKHHVTSSSLFKICCLITFAKRTIENPSTRGTGALRIL